MKLSKHILTTLLLLFVTLFSQANIAVRVVADNDMTTGDCMGYIEVIAEGDAGPFEITLIDNDFPNVIWDQSTVNAGSHTFYNLYYGQYTILVTNAYGCETSFTEWISCDCNMYIEFANFHLNNATSCSSTDGSVYVQGINPINNGQYPFDYLWSTGDTELSISNLSVGSYTLTVQDDNGCTAQETIIIEADEQPDLEATIMRPCKDLTNGVIEVFIFVMDTDTEVVFTWTGPTQLQPIQDGPSSRIENLGPGIYFLTIEDPESGCTIERQYVLEELELCDDEELAINENNIGYITSCPDQPTGGLSVYATGGNPSFNPALECDYSQYNYVWYNSDNEEVSQSKVHLTSQFAGSYRVEITDACGRMVTGQYIIPEYDRMVLRLESDLACPGMAVAELTVQGTTAPYIYQWSNGGQSETIEGLDEGIYSVTVTDKHGCKQSDSIFVETYPEMELDFTFSDACFLEGFDGGGVLVQTIKKDILEVVFKQVKKNLRLMYCPYAYLQRQEFL